jgi:hypothetical protein
MQKFKMNYYQVLADLTDPVDSKYKLDPDLRSVIVQYLTLNEIFKYFSEDPRLYKYVDLHNLPEILDLANSGDWEVVKYICNLRKLGIGILDELLYVAIKTNQLPIVKYFQKFKVGLHINHLVLAICSEAVEVVEFIYNSIKLTLIDREDLINTCIEIANVSIFKILNINDFTTVQIKEFIVGGKLDLIKYIISSGKVLNSGSYSLCIFDVGFEVFKYLYSIKIPLHPEIIEHLIYHNSMNHIRFLESQKYIFNDNDLTSAIKYNNLEVVKIIVASGVKITKTHLKTANNDNHNSHIMIDYLIDNF